MQQEDSLGNPGRSGGVDDASEVVGPYAGLWRIRRLLAQGSHLSLIIDTHVSDPIHRQGGCQAALRDDERTAGIFEHERQSPRRQAIVQGEVGRTGAQDAQDCENSAFRSAQAQGDDDIRPRSEAAQTMRQLIRTPVELRKRPLFVCKDHCKGLR